MTKCNCNPNDCCKPKVSTGKDCSHQKEYNKQCDSRIHEENSTDDNPTQFILVDKGVFEDGAHEYAAEPVPAKPTLEERQVIALEKIACRLKKVTGKGWKKKSNTGYGNDFRDTLSKRKVDDTIKKVNSTYTWKDYSSKKFKGKGCDC